MKSACSVFMLAAASLISGGDNLCASESARETLKKTADSVAAVRGQYESARATGTWYATESFSNLDGYPNGNEYRKRDGSLQITYLHQDYGLRKNIALLPTGEGDVEFAASFAGHYVVTPNYRLGVDWKNKATKEKEGGYIQPASSSSENGDFLGLFWFSDESPSDLIHSARTWTVVAESEELTSIEGTLDTAKTKLVLQQLGGYLLPVEYLYTVRAGLPLVHAKWEWGMTPSGIPYPKKRFRSHCLVLPGNQLRTQTSTVELTNINTDILIDEDSFTFSSLDIPHESLVWDMREAVPVVYEYRPGSGELLDLIKRTPPAIAGNTSVMPAPSLYRIVMIALVLAAGLAGLGYLARARIGKA